MTTPEPELANQSPPYEDVDLFASDRPLRDAVTSNAAGADRRGACSLRAPLGRGRRCSSGAGLRMHIRRGSKRFDARGFRRDTVEFHPAYHDLMAESVAEGLALLDLEGRCHAGAGTRPGHAGGALLHGGAGRDRSPLSAHDDARGGRSACRRAKACRNGCPQDRHAPLRPAFHPVVGERQASRSAWA